jgi:hypothetical protein
MDHVPQRPLLRAGDPRPPRFARGATYHQDALPDSGLRADVLVECTAAPTLVADVPARLSPDAIACLIGASGVGFRIPLNLGALNCGLMLTTTLHTAASTPAALQPERVCAGGRGRAPLGNPYIGALVNR